jgi:hypothetical protein
MLQVRYAQGLSNIIDKQPDPAVILSRYARSAANVFNNSGSGKSTTIAMAMILVRRLLLRWCVASVPRHVTSCLLQRTRSRSVLYVRFPFWCLLTAASLGAVPVVPAPSANPPAVPARVPTPVLITVHIVDATLVSTF